MKNLFRLSFLLYGSLLVTHCKSEPKNDPAQNSRTNTTSKQPNVPVYEYNEVFWGDTHLHTSFSGDAFGAGTRLTPEATLRLSIGEEITSNTGQKVRLARPLDFIAITDHAEGLGVFNEIAKGNEILMADSTALSWHNMLKGGKEAQAQLAVEIPYALANNLLPKPMTDPKTAVPILRSSWNEYTGMVEKYNRPGTFTAMQAYEWTSVTGGNNLHRNIIFRDGKDKMDSIIPFSALQSDDPEKLWEFLANYEQKTGGQVLAIPHNGNLSGGLMFGPRANGEPIDTDYAQERNRWEPLFEVMQIKGSSETHPTLSPNDEFANFGQVGWDNGNLTLDVLEDDEQRQYQNLRKALLDGMQYEEKLGINPFKYGFVSGTDAHTGLPTMNEDNWWGKHTTSEPSPERLNEVTKANNGITRYGWAYLSGGYSAVWAKSNTREAIWDAMKRRETYATTGTRIKLRVFGGFDFTASDIDSPGYLKTGYEKGVPMGGDLIGNGTPKLMILAQKDPNWANLDRVQVIKGWIDPQGQSHEKIYDVVWSGNRKPDAQGQLPAVGNTVDYTQATYTNTIGATELKTLWEDPDFNPAQRAFYYVRVLEIPSPTWQLYDIVKFNITENLPDKNLLASQERAWSSPIWYLPE